MTEFEWSILKHLMRIYEDLLTLTKIEEPPACLTHPLYRAKWNAEKAIGKFGNHILDQKEAE